MNQLEREEPYVGYHRDILQEVRVADIHGRDKWNIVMPPTEHLLGQVARIFGLVALPQLYWNEEDVLFFAQVPGR